MSCRRGKYKLSNDNINDSNKHYVQGSHFNYLLPLKSIILNFGKYINTTYVKLIKL